MSSSSTPASEWEQLTPEPPSYPGSVSSTLSPLIQKTAYKRLGENNIRLLVVQPGKQNSPIRCELLEVAHSSRPSYEALSYTWGSLECSRYITVNGTRFLVGWNLFHALRSLRFSNEARTIWVDALCINQDDISERNEQVLLMKRIYQDAAKVLVYLGESSDDIDAAFSVSVGARLRLAMPWTISPDFTTKRAKALITLCYRPYWRRVWIIQEILSASNLEILCGTKSIPWLHFRDMLQDVTTNIPSIKYLQDVGGACAKSPAAEIIRVHQSSGGTYSFKELLDLCTTCGSNCKDIRDRIYGLISLSRDVENKLIPDYTKSISQLYLDVLLMWLGSSSDYRLDQRLDWLGFMSNLQRVLQNPLWDKDLQAYLPLLRIGRPIQLSQMQNTLRFIWLQGLSRVYEIGPMTMTNEKHKAKEHVIDWELHANGSVLRDSFTRLSLRDFHRTEWLNVQYTLDPAGSSLYLSLDIEERNHLLGTSSTGRCRTFKTSDGCIGLASDAAQSGDVLCKASGIDGLYLITRRLKFPPKFILVGRALILRPGTREPLLRLSQLATITPDDAESCSCQIDAIIFFLLTR